MGAVKEGIECEIQGQNRDHIPNLMSFSLVSMFSCQTIPNESANGNLFYILSVPSGMCL